MRDFQTREFDGKTFTARPLDALKGMALCTKLLTTLGSDMMALLFASDEQDLTKRLAAADMTGLFYRLQAVGEDFVQDVMMKLMAESYVLDTERNPPVRSAKNCADDFNAVFSDFGGLKRAVLLVAWLGEMNYKHFLGVSQ